MSIEDWMLENLLSPPIVHTILFEIHYEDSIVLRAYINHPVGPIWLDDVDLTENYRNALNKFNSHKTKDSLVDKE